MSQLLMASANNVILGTAKQSCVFLKQPAAERWTCVVCHSLVVFCGALTVVVVYPVCVCRIWQQRSGLQAAS